MAFRIKERILEWLSEDSAVVTSKDINFEGLYQDLYIREIAFWSCANKVSNAISKCEFKTFVENKEVMEEEYYLWNFEPNDNQNSTVFIQKLVNQMFTNNEALVIEVNGQLLIADSFTKTPYALRENTYHDVEVDGFKFDKYFKEKEIMLFTLNSKNIKKLVNGMYETYSKLFSSSVEKILDSNGEKGVLNIDAQLAGGAENNKKLEKLMNEYFKNYFKNPKAVLPLQEGYSYQKTTGTQNVNGAAPTRDIKQQVDDVFEITGKAFGIPPSLARGDVQDTTKAIDELLTFSVDPIVDGIQAEIVRKRYGYEGFRRGASLKINTNTVKHIDIFDIATPIEKLISSAAFCVNDVRSMTGQQQIDEPWANKHFITKNFATMEEFLKAANGEGGTN